MGRVVVITNLTLDGVMQAPGRPDEDTRGGFKHGGWAVPFGAMMQAGEAFANMGGFLFGRRTYEDFYTVWPNRTDNPFTGILNSMQKYVASTTLRGRSRGSTPRSWWAMRRRPWPRCGRSTKRI